MPEPILQRDAAAAGAGKKANDSIFGGAIDTGDPLILERPRLNTLFGKALKSLIVFVTAGEGYGKTCAVHAFLRRKNKKAIWIPMSERDNDPLHFWESVTKAVGFHDPRAGKFLEEIGFPESSSQITRCLSALSGTGPERSKYVVVVDDCQVIHSEQVINFVSHLLSFPYRRETTIMISRSEPNLNAMPLLSKGFMARISADDLRFNGEEIAAYFRLRNISLSRKECASILADTEGWVLAISLIAQEMEKGNKKYDRSFLENGAFRRMEEKLLASVPASLRRFLVILSLFDQWPLEALEKIAAALPEQLPPMKELAESMNQLSSLIHYDAFLHGFRIHRIFLDYLREKQKELSPDEIKTACVIAAQWCLENRLLTDAAINFGMAEDYGGLITAIYSSPRYLTRPVAASFLEILDRLLNGSKQNSKEKNFLFLLHVTRPGLLLNMGRYDESRTALERSIREFEALPPDDLSSWILSTCYNTLGALSLITHHITHDTGKIVEYFERGNYYYMRNPYLVSGPKTRASIGSYVNLVGHPPEEGEFERFSDAITRSLPYASQSIGGYLIGTDSLCRAELAFFKGDLNSAEQHARETVFKARESTQYEVESKALFYLLRIYLCTGNVGSCRETWAQMEALLNIADYIDRYVIYDIMAGWFYSHCGITEQIAPWLLNEYEESDLNVLYYSFETIVKAKCLFAEKRYADALKFLNRKEVRKGLGSIHLGLLEISALEAAVRSRMGDEAAALETLEAAYKISALNSGGHSTAFEMPFIELGEDMRTLAGTALNSEECAIPKPWLETIRNKASVYAKKLGMAAEQFSNRQGEKEIPFLTSQELSVLTGISQGLTREEIASGSSVSINTVKIVIKTIYEKLGAVNRADAIRIATKAGLLKS